MIKSAILQIADKFGYSIEKKTKKIEYILKGSDEEFYEIYLQCKNYTMTSIERMYSLYSAVRYVIQSGIQGDFVECGVWKGGSAMLIALTLKQLNVKDRKIMLFDTYEGMSEPTKHDVDINGNIADTLMNNSDKSNQASVWCYASLAEVKYNLGLTGYPEENMLFIKGKVEQTIDDDLCIHQICLLRLDTDWYESTLHELNFLYPKLQPKGILILDDYGHWGGAKKAVDEYFSHKDKIFLAPIDYTGRIAIKS
jgi:O-methyltransferase